MLVTCALPYANGSLHLGHFVEYIQADIWVRFHRMMGHHCVFICGEDAHGTPVMLAAQQRHITPEQLVEQIAQEHRCDLHAFHICFDLYHTTHSIENQTLSELIYQRMQNRGDIAVRTITQAYDAQAKMFLPDRYVKGACPKCKTPDQYGDHCEFCGATYSPLELIDPVSVLSGSTPITRESEHYFFKLSNYKDFLHEWISSRVVTQDIQHKLLEWFKHGLNDLDISRDAPYFGFKIPNTNQYFYVWLDAPIGYMAIFKHLCTQRPELNFDTYWQDSSQTQLYHFIGKDIINFHAIFWPAILKSSGFRLPTQIFVHGYLTVNGKKMSKSRGTFIQARTYLDHFPADFLRYYFSGKLSAKSHDIDFKCEDFMARINSELIGKLINLVSRCARIINQHFNHRLSHCHGQLIEKFIDAETSIAQYYQQREYHHVIRIVMDLTDAANQYLEQNKPWICVQKPESKQLAQSICTTGLNLFRILMVYLKPILPMTTQQTEQFLNISPLTWGHHKELLVEHTIGVYQPLHRRITQAQINAFIQANQKVD